MVQTTVTTSTSDTETTTSTTTAQEVLTTMEATSTADVSTLTSPPLDFTTMHLSTTKTAAILGACYMKYSTLADENDERNAKFLLYDTKL